MIAELSGRHNAPTEAAICNVLPAARRMVELMSHSWLDGEEPMSIDRSPRGLTPAQRDAYRRDGYLLVQQPILPAEEFDALRQHFEVKLAALPPDIRPEAMDVPHFTDLALFRWLFADAVLDLVEPLLGPNLALWSSHFICKPKGDGKRVPWHEDSAYWRGRLDPMEVVTVWLAIDSSRPENGCMYVIPGTQHHGCSDYEDVDRAKNVFPTEIKAAQRDESKAVPCVLQPNQASLHDGRLIHGSPPNHSAVRRCGYTMRYMPTHVKHTPTLTADGQPGHQIYVARGKDLAGNEYGDPTVSYDALARYRERSGKTGH
jgi:ectoine hydroxylase-related dioxygenase (phytanoyl-CoA dioxygenase family)